MWSWKAMYDRPATKPEWLGGDTAMAQGIKSGFKDEGRGLTALEALMGGQGLRLGVHLVDVYEPIPPAVSPSGGEEEAELDVRRADRLELRAARRHAEAPLEVDEALDRYGRREQRTVHSTPVGGPAVRGGGGARAESAAP